MQCPQKIAVCIPFKNSRNGIIITLTKDFSVLYIPTSLNYSFHILLLFPPQSVSQSRSVVSDSLRPHESQHARPPSPSPTPGVHLNSHPSSQWCHPAISSSVIPFSSCPQSLPASESFPMSQLFAWGGQSSGVSALASFLPRTPGADLLLLYCFKVVNL